jgi:cold shock CspA family protein
MQDNDHVKWRETTVGIGFSVGGGDIFQRFSAAGRRGA